MKNTNENFIDLLKLEGINFKGFGYITKFVMTDITLSLEAKSIYAYFNSYVGSGVSAFPSRSKILNDLSIGKNAYYRHYNQLLEQGYISVYQEKVKNEKTGKVRLSRNIYTIISSPKKYIDYLQKTSNDMSDSSVKIKGSKLKSLGYGIIPKSVMLDKRLTIKAKGIYAYFCSFTGSGNSAFPELEDITYHLQISKNTYYNHYKFLKECNYITSTQRISRGKYSISDYYLNDNPDEKQVIKKPCTKNGDTEEVTDFRPSFEKPYTKNGDTEKGDTQKGDTQKGDTINNNSINNNSINNNNPTIHLDEQYNRKELMERDNVRKEIQRLGEIPYYYTQEIDKMQMAIHILTEYADVIEFNKMNTNSSIDSNLYIDIFKLFNSALVDMLTIENNMNFSGSIVTKRKVYEKVSEYVNISDKEMNIYDLQVNTINSYTDACQTYEIKNPLAYMKSIIWNNLQIGNLVINTMIKKNLG